MKSLFAAFTIFLFSMFFSGCEFIGDVFKTGVWVGIIIIIAIIVIITLIVKIFSK